MEPINAFLAGIQLEQWLVLICVIVVAGIIFRKMLRYAIVVAALIVVVFVIFPKYFQIIHDYILNR